MATIRSHTIEKSAGTFALRLTQSGGVAAGDMPLTALRVEPDPSDATLFPTHIATDVAVTALFERDTGLLQAIRDGGDTTFGVEIDLDGSPFFRGYALPDLVTKGLDLIDEGSSFRASDGLHLLEKQLYTDSEGTPWADRSRTPYSQALIELLEGTGLGLDVWIAPRYRADGVTGDPLAGVTIDRGRFTDEKGVASNKLAALVQLLGDQKLTLVQREGRWHIMHRSLLHGSSYTAYKYQPDGTYLGTETIAGTTTIDVQEAGGTGEDMQPYSEASHRYDHGPISDLVPNGTFEGTPYDVGWTKVRTYGTSDDDVFKSVSVGKNLNGERKQTTAMAVRGWFAGLDADAETMLENAGRALRTITGPSISEIPGATLRHTIAFRVRFEYDPGERGPTDFSSARTGYWARQVGTNWLQPDGSWVSSGSPLWMPIKATAQGFEGVTIASSIPPGGGVCVTYIGTTVDNRAIPSPAKSGIPEGQNTEENFTLFGLWDDIHCQPIFEGEEEWSATETAVRVTGSTVSVAADTYVARFGQGPTPEHAGSLLRVNGSLAIDWAREGITTTPTVLETLMVEDILRAQRTPPERRRITLHMAWAGVLYPLDRVLIGGNVFTAYGPVLDLVEATIQADFVEVNDQTFLSEVTTVREEEATFFADTGGFAQVALDRDDLLVSALEVGLVRTSATLAPDTDITEIPIDTLAEALPAFEAGKKGTIINRANGRRYLFQIREEQVAGDSVLKVADPDDVEAPLRLPEYVWIQSSITSTEREAQASITLTRDAFRTSLLAGSLCLLTEALVSTTPVSEIKVTPTKAFLEAGAKLEGMRALSGTTFTVWVTRDTARNARTLPITSVAPRYDEAGTLLNATALAVDAPVDTAFRIPDDYRQSESIQTGFSITDLVTTAQLEALRRELTEADRAVAEDATDLALTPYTLGGQAVQIRRRFADVLPDQIGKIKILGTRIDQTDEAVAIRATRLEVSALTQGGRFGLIAAGQAIQEGSDTLTLAAPGAEYALSSGEPLEVVAYNGSNEEEIEVVTVTLTASVAEGATSIPITSPSAVVLYAGNVVRRPAYRTARQVLLNQADLVTANNRITATVGIYKAVGAVAEITSNGAGSITQMVANVDIDLPDDERVVLVDASGTAHTRTLTAAVGAGVGRLISFTPPIAATDDQFATGYLVPGFATQLNLLAGEAILNSALFRINADTIFAAGYDPTTKIAAGGAAADINANITTISGGKITTGSITASQIAADAITTEKIVASAIDADKIKTAAITTIKIAAGAVTATEIATSAVTTDKLFASAVTTDKIATNAVDADKIKAGAITTIKLAASAVTAGEIAANAVTTDKIAAGAITAVKIAAGAITANDITTGTLSLGGYEFGSSGIQREIELGSGDSHFWYLSHVTTNGDSESLTRLHLVKSGGSNTATLEVGEGYNTLNLKASAVQAGGNTIYHEGNLTPVVIDSITTGTPSANRKIQITHGGSIYYIPAELFV